MIDNVNPEDEFSGFIRGGQVDEFKRCMESFEKTTDLAPYILIAVKNDRPAMLARLLEHTWISDRERRITRRGFLDDRYKGDLPQQFVESVNILSLALDIRCDELIKHMVRSRPDVINWEMMWTTILFHQDHGLRSLWDACPDEKTKRHCANLGLLAAAGDSRDECISMMRAAHALGADDFDTALGAAVDGGTIAGMRLCISWGAVLTHKMILSTGHDIRMSPKLLFYLEKGYVYAVILDVIAECARRNMFSQKYIDLKFIIDALPPNVDDRVRQSLTEMLDRQQRTPDMRCRS